MSNESKRISRRDAIRFGAAAGAGLALDRVMRGQVPDLFGYAPEQAALNMRAIPSSGEKLPVIGMGTARNYENPTPDQMPALREVIRQFPEMGGRVLDTAPAYGRAEVVVGDLMAELKNRDKYFIATKVSVGGRGGGAGAGSPAEMANASLERSLSRFHTDRIDLMQVWNLSSPDVLLPILDEWKAAKKIRYVGVTTSNARQYDQVETILKTRKLDFIQVDLAIDNRGAQERVIPAAMDHGAAVLVNLPFGRGRPFERVKGKPLPGWASEIDCTDWSQVFLKYIVGNPGVTCVIPGTEKVEFLTLNIGAARGRLPDAAMRKRIEKEFDSLVAS